MAAQFTGSRSIKISDNLAGITGLALASHRCDANTVVVAAAAAPVLSQTFCAQLEDFFRRYPQVEKFRLALLSGVFLGERACDASRLRLDDSVAVPRVVGGMTFNRMASLSLRRRRRSRQRHQVEVSLFVRTQQLHSIATVSNRNRNNSKYKHK
ncbi:unnamed protein product [Ceratitis capitata]|uniref:(Mediterranean fruit fly) hypothetical protein n=1 Tax=Ceratitis capitata TaxID=7213 RepID=A0A811UWE8_CERCA|nr:unnamed protein product [Ceratitis capitata]